MPATFSFGDLVVARDAGPDAPLGLVAECRRTDCRVFHPGSGTSAWCALDGIEPAPADRVRGSLESRVADLLRLLGAVEMEFIHAGAGGYRLIAGHGALRPETVDQVRSFLGADLRRYIIRPSGMRRMQTILEFDFEGKRGAWRPEGG